MELNPCTDKLRNNILVLAKFLYKQYLTKEYK